ncbi:hypothetical protein [Streptomyces sp. NPDC047315]|uniref:hypothetical protein n=1 Tax=Streptomyces sp. NPDC047315 TaxID=3155142 RepID=UPI003405CAD2
MNGSETAQADALHAVRHALDALGCWRLREWAETARVAGEAPVLVWDALKETGAWGELAEHDRAGLHWCLADGHRISMGWPLSVSAEEYRGPITALCSDVAYFASRCDPAGEVAWWPEADGERSDHGSRAVELLRRYEKLPVLWRAAVLRRVHSTRRPVLIAGPPMHRSYPSFVEVLDWAADRAERGVAPPEPDYQELRTVDGPELVKRIGELPEGWQVEAVRRVAAGGEPVAVESGARNAIGTVRSYGVLAGGAEGDAASLCP